MLCYLILRNYHCHGLNAKCSVQTVVLIQEELTKEERQDSYATQLLKGASYVSSCSRSHVRRRSAPSIYIGCNPLHVAFLYKLYIFYLLSLSFLTLEFEYIAQLLVRVLYPKPPSF